MRLNDFHKITQLILVLDRLKVPIGAAAAAGGLLIVVLTLFCRRKRTKRRKPHRYSVKLLLGEKVLALIFVVQQCRSI